MNVEARALCRPNVVSDSLGFILRLSAGLRGDSEDKREVSSWVNPVIPWRARILETLGCTRFFVRTWPEGSDSAKSRKESGRHPAWFQVSSRDFRRRGL